MASLVSAIRNIVATSNNVLAELDDGVYEETGDDTFCYEDKKLSQGEKYFYTDCSTVDGVLDLHHKNILKEKINDNYELFPVHCFNEEQKRRE